VARNDRQGRAHAAKLLLDSLDEDENDPDYYDTDGISHV